jgi:hypothetical protein
VSTPEEPRCPLCQRAIAADALAARLHGVDRASAAGRDELIDCCAVHGRSPFHAESRRRLIAELRTRSLVRGHSLTAVA